MRGTESLYGKTNMMTGEELLKLAQRYEKAGRYIQGFLYGDVHVIRDLRKPYVEQKIWSHPALGMLEREMMEEQMMIEYMRFAMEHCE